MSAQDLPATVLDEAMEAARRIVDADEKMRRQPASIPNSPGIMIGGKCFIELKDQVAAINAALSFNAPFRVDGLMVARALLSRRSPLRAERDAVLSLYRDCGKCPYLGGCTHCEHPEWREIIYARIATAKRDGIEAAAKVADDFANRGQSKADKIHAAFEIAQRIRALKAEGVEAGPPK